MKLKGQVAVITGSAQGIGRSVAEALAAEGCSVVISDINEALAQQTANEISEKFKVTKLRVYVSIQNVFTITKYSGLDPELGATSTSSTSQQQLNMGVDYGNYPVARTILGGINLTL